MSEIGSLKHPNGGFYFGVSDTKKNRRILQERINNDMPIDNFFYPGCGYFERLEDIYDDDIFYKSYTGEATKLRKLLIESFMTIAYSLGIERLSDWFINKMKNN